MVPFKIIPRAEENGDHLLRVYADASYNTGERKRGQTGIIVEFAGVPIEIISHQQTTTGKSPTENEVRAISEAEDKVSFWRRVLEKIGYKQNKPTEIFTDCHPAMDAIENASVKRLEQVAQRVYAMNDRLKEGMFVLKYIPTEEFIVDPLTKCKTGRVFQEFQNRVMSSDLNGRRRGHVEENQ